MSSRVGRLGRRVATLVVLIAAIDAHAWLVRKRPPGGAGYGVSVAVGTDGNPVVAGGISTGPSDPNQFHVAKHRATDGSEIWHFETTGIVPAQYSDALAVRVDAAGDVIVTGDSYSTADVSDTIVVKLSGTDGSVLWRVDIAGPYYQSLYWVTLTPDGDALLSGSEGPSGAYVARVYRLDGATGATEWSASIVGTAGTGIGTSTAVDSAGDVFFGGEITDLGPDKSLTVAKLTGTTGVEIWRSTLAGGHEGIAEQIAVDAADDVVVGGDTVGSPSPDLFPVVAKFDGATGAPLWRYDLDDSPGDYGYVSAIALDPTGNVYATGSHENSLLAAKLDGTTGSALWQRDITGKLYGLAGPVALDPLGVPAFGGQFDGRFTVLSLDATTGDTQWTEDLVGDQNNSGYVAGLAFDGTGFLYAVGSSVFPLIPNQGNQFNRALTILRLPDANDPPVVGNCSAAPRTDCRASIAAGKSQLAIRDRAGTRLDRLQWKWARGAATTAGDYGAPLSAGNDFDLCLYDGAGSRLFSVVIPGGGTCGTVPCWRDLGGNGFDYKTKSRDPEGLDRLVLRAGTAGRAKIVAKRAGREGVDLPGPAIASLTLPLTVQLQRGSATCFGAAFSAAGIVKNDGITFKARSD